MKWSPKNIVFSCVLIFALILGLSSAVFGYDAAEMQFYRTVDPHQKAVEVASAPLPDNLKELTGKLIYGTNDPLMKAKIILDFVALSLAYDVQGLYGEGERYQPEGAMAILEYGFGICGDYAKVAREILFCAGIQTCYVSGKVKKISPEQGKRANGHAWVLIHIPDDQGNCYHYVADPTWMAGYVEDDPSSACGKRFVFDYDYQYLFPNPAHLMYSHFSDQCVHYYELIGNITYEEWWSKPRLDPLFFEHRLAMIQPDINQQPLVVSSCITPILFDAPETTAIRAHIYNSEGEEVGETFVQHQSGGYIELYLNIPSTEEHYLKILSRDNPDDTYTRTAYFIVQTAVVSSNPNVFPRTYSQFTQNNGYLLNVPSLYYPIDPDHFNLLLQIDNATSVAVLIMDEQDNIEETIPFIRGGNIFRLNNAQLPDDTDLIKISALFNGDSRYWAICLFELDNPSSNEHEITE